MAARLAHLVYTIAVAGAALAFAPPAAAEDGCPGSQVVDDYTGECVLDMMSDSWDTEPAMFTVNIGPTYPGGQVPSVGGIPCTPEHYGTCIGLQQNQMPHTQPRSTISHSP